MQDLFNMKNVEVRYNHIPILRDITVTVKKGEILGVVGESGSGKSTLIRAAIGLLGGDGVVADGEITFEGTDLRRASTEEMRKIRGVRMGMVFQNPGMSFNSIRRIGPQFLETMRSHGKVDEKEAKERILELFSKLNLQGGDRILNSYPFELSGGMNQRVAIALAMVLNPALLLADEPTSALDVTVQAQAVKEMMRLRDLYGTSIVIVTHNMGVVSHMVDKIAVMYAGRMVEYGPKRDVMRHPRHPYTQALISAIPQINGGTPKGIEGRPPVFGEEFSGCSFAPRCPAVAGLCRSEEPSRHTYAGEHWALCHACSEEAAV